MKSILLGCVAALALSGISYASAPDLTVDKAAALAQKELKDHGLEGRVFITSCAIEVSGIVKGDRHWVAMYSEAIPGDDQKKEVGLRINMNGDVIHLVQGPGDVEHLRNHYTRSDRPSILDLKR